MDEELVVAVYDTEQRAEAAMRDLRDAGVPESAIDRHAKDSAYVSTDTPEQHDKPSFWQRLFGMDSGHDTSDYDRNVEQGAIVIAVRASAGELERIEAILEKHDPVDLDERNAHHASGTAAGGMGMNPAMTSGQVGEPDTLAGDRAEVPPAAGINERHDATREEHDATRDEEVLPLAEEELTVGKRDVTRGTTRVRRYVVDTPVEEDVRLRDESVSIERRPVTGDRTLSDADADFTDKTVEMTETDEEAVVGKRTHVREEVAVRKDVGEHTEHVSDHVRHHEVDVDETDATSKGTREDVNDANDDPLLDPTRKTDR